MIFLGCLTSKASFKIELRTAGETNFKHLIWVLGYCCGEVEELSIRQRPNQKVEYLFKKLWRTAHF